MGRQQSRKAEGHWHGEGLVRAASRDPGRLEPVRRLIEDFRSTEEGRRIVPDDFLELWSAVDEVLREDGRS